MQRFQQYCAEEPTLKDRVVRLHHNEGVKILPPRAEVWVPVKLCGKGNHKLMTAIVEGSRLHVHTLRTWRMARGIVSWRGEGQTHVRIVNAGSVPVQLPGDVVLGTWEALDEATVAEVSAISIPGGLAG